MPTGLDNRYPRLLADIGGTNARFALQTERGLANIRVMACAEHPTFDAAVHSYLAAVGTPAVRHAAIGIANPVHGDWVQMTNHDWAFSIEATREAMGLSTLLVMNDFTALALSLPHLPQEDLVQVGGTATVPGAAIGLLGAGTGLGISGLIPASGGAVGALAGEGGHVSFTPFDEQEIDLWRFAHARHGHVSAERILSGPGLQLIHEWLSTRAGVSFQPLTAAEISRRGLEGHDALCCNAIDMFCGALGTVAGDLALILGARGGMYVGGGIVPKFGEYFARSPFRSRFQDKGRFSKYLAAIPVFVITSAWPSLIGAASALDEHLERAAHA